MSETIKLKKPFRRVPKECPLSGKLHKQEVSQELVSETLPETVEAMGDHPTKKLLLATVITELDTHDAEHLTAEHILEVSGVAKGSLYHHFKDFPELLECALVVRYSKYGQSVVSALTEILNNNANIEDARAAFGVFIRSGQTRYVLADRYERIACLYRASQSEHMKSLLSVEQEKINQQWVTVYKNYNAKGWAVTGLEPRTVGILFQSTLVGRVIGDISAYESMDLTEWEKTVTYAVNAFLFNGSDKQEDNGAH